MNMIKAVPLFLERSRIDIQAEISYHNFIDQ